MKSVRKKSNLKNNIILFVLVSIINIGCAQKRHTSFKPGEIWTDTDGVHINAHGAGITIVGDTYYMVGEHKVAGWRGNKSWVGVRMYSSKDLYNWKNEGVALKVDKNPASKLVEGSVIERPKVIYNDKTKKYQKLNTIPFCEYSCHIAINERPVKMAPMKTYCLLFPHFDFVLSDINPIKGSVIASTSLGTKAITPYNNGLKPKFCINTTMKIPSAAGNI